MSSSPSQSPVFEMKSSPVPASRNVEAERYLRQTLCTPHGVPVNLRTLPDEPFDPGYRPKVTDLIKLAIWGSEMRQLTLRGIYDAIETRYPSYKSMEDKPWQRSVRHSLSLKAMFVHTDRPHEERGKGSYWTLDISKGEGMKPTRHSRKHLKVKENRARRVNQSSAEVEEQLVNPFVGSISAMQIQNLLCADPNDHLNEGREVSPSLPPASTLDNSFDRYINADPYKDDIEPLGRPSSSKSLIEEDMSVGQNNMFKRSATSPPSYRVPPSTNTKSVQEERIARLLPPIEHISEPSPEIKQDDEVQEEAAKHHLA